MDTSAIETARPRPLRLWPGLAIAVLLLLIRYGIPAVFPSFNLMYAFFGGLIAALLIGLIHAFGVSLFPQATLVIVFLTMAVVLAWRPQGLLGAPIDASPREIAQKFHGVPVKWTSTAIVFIAIVLLGARTPCTLPRSSSTSASQRWRTRNCAWARWAWLIAT